MSLMMSERDASVLSVSLSVSVNTLQGRSVCQAVIMPMVAASSCAIMSALLYLLEDTLSLLLGREIQLRMEIKGIQRDNVHQECWRSLSFQIIPPFCKKKHYYFSPNILPNSIFSSSFFFSFFSRWLLYYLSFISLLKFSLLTSHENQNVKNEWKRSIGWVAYKRGFFL